ncbi:MAG TPA: DUF3105 domain-containing protein [Actinomycetota bacterium]|jgi:hypothetical protein|nr:DUF3105 domain-containing protein [Actinomycetota bacterium]
MAKKKRKHRRPVAPPVHSAPGTAHAPSGPPTSQPSPVHPVTPEPPPSASEPWTHATPGRPATRAPARRKRARGKSKTRPYVIAGLVVLALVGAFVARSMFTSRQVDQFNKLAVANGCSEVRETGGSGSGQHLPVGGTTRYDSSPPTHGAHDGRGVVPHGIYDKPFGTDPEKQPSIYRAVHSLEHGYIIVWHKGLTSDQERALERKYRDERKVIVVPYAQLRGDTKVALTAWGRIVRCEGSNTRVIDAFVERYREARSAPEPKAA